MMMDTTEQLLVRACKAPRNPYKRLNSVYRRYYCAGQANRDFHLASILADLSDRYLEIGIRRIMSDLNPENRCLFGMSKDTPYWSAAVRVLIAYIASAEATRFPGIRPPAVVRKSIAGET